ncbi:MAG: ferredoxin [Candidatus Woesearchaeota archaeon]
MTKYKIIFKKDECIGCGACTVQCPENWELAEEGGMYKAKPKKLVLDNIGKNQEAKEVCPVNCIDIIKE